MSLWLASILWAVSSDASPLSWPDPEGRQLPASCRRPNSGPDDAILPFLLQTVPLEDVSFYVKGGSEVDTFVRFSPDGQLLAIGTFLGHIRVIHVYTGKRLWEKQIAEGLVKQIDFSADGQQIYFGEQSVDGFIYAADAMTGNPRWRFRLADDLKTSAPPERDDVFGIYQLPGCFRLKAVGSGDLLALGIHAWGDYRKVESMTRLSRVYRLSPEGKVLWAFPPKGPAPLTLIYMDSDPAARRVAVLVTQEGGNPREDLPCTPGSIYVLDGHTGQPIGHYAFEPLHPYFQQVWFWQSVSVRPDGKMASIGLHDGRTFLFDLDTVKPKQMFTFGTPVVISGVPVSARATYTFLAPDGIAYFQTGNSSVPYASTMQHVVTPPGPHPHANTINAVDAEGAILWRYRSGHEYQNFWTSADGRWLLTCIKRDDPKKGRDSGGLLFDTRRPGGGSAKLVYNYPVQGLCFFQADMARDGAAFALVETPYKDPQTSKIVGTYQVHIVR
jgi:outer membrane protein assembly factor BamB